MKKTILLQMGTGGSPDICFMVCICYGILSEDGFTIRQGRTSREVLWNRISLGCEVHFCGSQWIILSTDGVIDRNESLQLITYHWYNRRTDFQANCRENNHLLVFCSDDYSPEQWHIFWGNLVARNKLI